MQSLQQRQSHCRPPRPQQQQQRQQRSFCSSSSCCCRPRRRAAAAAVVRCQALLVKVCGVTNAADAAFAAQQGADLVGMIMWPKAKRSVDNAAAAAIAAAARSGGAQPVGVFVDEDGPAIAAACTAAGVGIAQLHGDGARAALAQVPRELQVVYVLQANDAGQIVTPVPGTPGGPPLARDIDWLLVDGMTGGSGKAFSWDGLQVPAGVATRGWLLAGGLHPGNVAAAVAAAAPGGVDVSSGVCDASGLTKDHAKVAAFVAGAKAAVGSGAAQEAAAAASS